jgi:predicted amidohydrolase
VSETDQSTNPAAASILLAVAQTTPNVDPSDPAGFRSRGNEIRDLQRRAARESADVVQFPEGALCFPAKRRLSSDPDRMAEADWSRFAWDVLEAEIDSIRATSRELGIVTVLGVQIRPADAAPSPTAGPSRPTTSLLVIGTDGGTLARYDERFLSRTKQTFLYVAGTSPTTLEVGGVKLGLASGLEILFPEVVNSYEADGCDVVLFSSAGPGEPDRAESLATSARAAALQNGVAIGYAVPTLASASAPSVAAGIVGSDGIWSAQCTSREHSDLVVAKVRERTEGEPREWHRRMRSRV